PECIPSAGACKRCPPQGDGRDSDRALCTIEQFTRLCYFRSMRSSATRRVPTKVRRPRHKEDATIPAFKVPLFLQSAGLGRKVVRFQRNQTVFAQGDPATSVIYVQEGGVKLTVVNNYGKEAVVAIHGPGDFLGEGCLGGQSICVATATAIAPTTALVIQKREMIRALREE